MRSTPARNQATLWSALGLMIAFSASGCGRPAVPEPDAVALAHRRVLRSVTRGVDAANDLGEFVATLRHNPGECECPPWEIAIGTRWERVAVVPARDAGDDVTAWLSTPAGEFETVIEVSREETRSETGWGYRMLLIGGSSRPTEMEK